MVKPGFGYCHYTGYWYCTTCISKEKKLIPWYVLDNWDFKSYTVSKESKEDLDKLYTKAILKIDLQMDIVKKNKYFYETLVINKIYFNTIIVHNLGTKIFCCCHNC